jgi:DNA-directed RNA polymerase specialized sigma24 family protein
LNKIQRENDGLTKSLRLVALAALENLPFKRQVWLMSKSGFQPAEIAEILDTTSNSVSVRLSEMRREAQKAVGREANR